MRQTMYAVSGAILFVLALTITFPATPSNGQPLPKGKKVDNPKSSRVQQYIALLNEDVDIGVLKQPATRIGNVVAFLSSKANNSKGIPLPIVVDTVDFKMEDPDAPDVRDTEVTFPKSVKSMTRAMVLRFALSHVPTDNATFLVRRDGVRITTLNTAAVPQLLREKVTAVYDKKPLQDVARELGQVVGVTVVIDPRAKDKINTPITATFTNDVSLGAAFDMLADMADLKCIVNMDSVYVTTSERFKALEKEILERQKLRAKFFPAIPGAGTGVLGGVQPGGLVGGGVQIQGQFGVGGGAQFQGQFVGGAGQIQGQGFAGIQPGCFGVMGIMPANPNRGRWHQSTPDVGLGALGI